jgi:hypothetical protein
MSSMSITDAQQQMRHAYYDGAPGVFASALAWLASGVVAITMSPKYAVVALFVGGALIFPVSVLISKLLGRPGRHARDNPLGMLAMEGTFFMLLALPIAYVVSLYRVEWFFPAMLLIIGGRYLTFSTLYGMRAYWALGGTLVAAAFALVFLKQPPMIGAFAGGTIEAVFAAVLFVISRRSATTLEGVAPPG